MPDHAEDYYGPFEMASQNRIKSDYANHYALLSWLVEALTTADALRSGFEKDEISILFGECLQRFRSSQLLATRGYASDGLALLRSVFEIVKSLNAIHNGVISCEEYIIGASYQEGFQELAPDKMQRRIEEHNREVDRKVNRFDAEGLPDAILPSLRVFKSYLHQSVHKSLLNTTLQLAPYLRETKFNPFVAQHPIDTFRIYFNTSALLVCMYMRCLLQKDYLEEIGVGLFPERVTQIEGSYARMNEQYYTDLVSYVRLRFLVPGLS